MPQNWMVQLTSIWWWAWKDPCSVLNVACLERKETWEGTLKQSIWPTRMSPAHSVERWSRPGTVSESTWKKSTEIERLDCLLCDMTENTLQIKLKDSYQNIYFHNECHLGQTWMEGVLKPNFSGLLESMIAKMDDGVGFVCLVCQKVVLHKGNLKKHIVSMHIGESPQECTLCGKSFKNLNSLQNHTSIHHRGLMPVHSQL